MSGTEPIEVGDWLTVRESRTVYADEDRSRRIGSLPASGRYRVVAVDESFVGVPGPGGTIGWLKRADLAGVMTVERARNAVADGTVPASRGGDARAGVGRRTALLVAAAIAGLTALLVLAWALGRGDGSDLATTSQGTSAAAGSDAGDASPADSDVDAASSGESDPPEGETTPESDRSGQSPDEGDDGRIEPDPELFDQVVVGEAFVEGDPSRLLASGDRIYALDPTGGVLSSVDADSVEVTGLYESDQMDNAFVGERVWSIEGGNAVALNPATLAVDLVQGMDLGAEIRGIVDAGGRTWILDELATGLVINPRSLEVELAVGMLSGPADDGVYHVVAHSESVWVSNFAEGDDVLVLGDTGIQHRSGDLGGVVEFVRFDDAGDAWASSGTTAGGRLSRLDAQAQHISTFELPSQPHFFTRRGEVMWVLDSTPDRFNFFSFPVESRERPRIRVSLARESTDVVGERALLSAAGRLLFVGPDGVVAIDENDDTATTLLDIEVDEFEVIESRMWLTDSDGALWLLDLETGASRQLDLFAGPVRDVFAFDSELWLLVRIDDVASYVVHLDADHPDLDP